MSDVRENRKSRQAQHLDPKNFTCGICGKVHPFVDKRYECPDRPKPVPDNPSPGVVPDGVDPGT